MLQSSVVVSLEVSPIVCLVVLCGLPHGCQSSCKRSLFCFLAHPLFGSQCLHLPELGLNCFRSMLSAMHHQFWCASKHRQVKTHHIVRISGVAQRAARKKTMYTVARQLLLTQAKPRTCTIIANVHLHTYRAANDSVSARMIFPRVFLHCRSSPQIPPINGSMGPTCCTVAPPKESFMLE